MAKYIQVKTLDELNQPEIELFLSNETVQNEIVNYALESESDYVFEILDCVRDGLDDWSVGAFSYDNKMIVSIEKAHLFLDGLHRTQENYRLIDTLRISDLLNETEIMNNQYKLTEMYTDEFYELEDALKNNLNELSNILLDELVSQLEYYSNYETVEKESDYVNNYLDCYYDTEVAITEKGVNFITY